MSGEQLRYAATDAAVTRALWEAQETELAAAGCRRAYDLAKGAQPAVAAMRLAGVPFDLERHRAFLTALAPEHERLNARLSRALRGNPRSGEEWSHYLAFGLGREAAAAWPKTAGGEGGGAKRRLRTDEETLAAFRHLLPPEEQAVVDDLLAFREADKLLSGYGERLAAGVRPGTNRLAPSLVIPGSVAGRMSCHGPNVQNMPRRRDFRALFAAPAGRRFAIADFGAIELRVAAMLAGEERLLAAIRDGRDPHRATAAAVLGKPVEAVTTEERQLAKSLNFGLLFGQGAAGLRAYARGNYGVAMALAEAEAYRDGWFRTYPAFRAWQQRTDRAARKALAGRTVAGRERRWLHAHRGEPGAYSMPEALNTPVQGSAAEGLLASLAELDARLDGAGLDAVPILAVHDEIVVEASEADAPAAAAVLADAMVAGMLAVFPAMPTRGLAEVKVGLTWGDKG